jgi:hypothetical protein
MICYCCQGAIRSGAVCAVMQPQVKEGVRFNPSKAVCLYEGGGLANKRTTSYGYGAHWGRDRGCLTTGLPHTTYAPNCPLGWCRFATLAPCNASAVIADDESIE